MLYLPSSVDYTKEQVNSFIKVKSCYFISLEKEMSYSQRFLECSEMIYVMSGTLYLTVGQTEFTVGEGDALLLPFYKTITGTRATDGSIRFWTLEFDCSESLLDGIGERVVSIKENAYLFNELFPMISRDSLTTAADRDAALLLALQIIRLNARTQVRDFSMLNSIMDYINVNISRIFTIEEIADHFNYNKDYVMKLFKAKCGITIKKYINEKKLTLVKRLLTTTEMSVEKIGQSIGFEDTELFQKYFKYYEKVTPQQFRKTHR